MDLKSVVNDLVHDQGLEKDKVINAICSGLAQALHEKNVGLLFKVSLSQSAPANSDFVGLFDVFVKKKVVELVVDENSEISLSEAKKVNVAFLLNDLVDIPFKKNLSRTEIVLAKGFISESIKKLEQEKVYNLFKDKVGSLISGSMHKAESGGFSINIGDVTAFLPKSLAHGLVDVRAGAPVKAVLKQVFPYSGKNAQIILDRSSVDFVLRLMEIEVPEIFDGIVEIVKAERIVGYRTKILLKSNAKNIDPVGACIGMAGGRIKSIRSELSDERIDLIPWTDDKESLLKRCLKTRDSDKEVGRVVFHSQPSGEYAEIWVSQDMKSTLIGKGGGNISLASRLVGMQIRVRQEGVEN